MQYTKLGNSALTVSRICMGCMGFGDAAKGHHSWTLDPDASADIIRRGLELGINFFDTAIAYQGGTGEAYLGQALRKYAQRKDVVVATKFSPRSPAEIAAGVSGQQHVEQSLNESLRHLGMDYIDLYICHKWDYTTPIEEIMDGLSRAIRAGKVRAIGISNCYAWQLAKANALAEKEGFPKFVSIQGHYNLIFREEEREMVPLCREDNIALTPYSSLAAGRLARLPEHADSRRQAEDAVARSKYGNTVAQDALIIHRVAEIAKRRGVSMTEVSLAWLLAHSTAPVVGATKATHVEGAVKALELTLTEDECAYLEEPYVPHKLVGVMGQNLPPKA